MLETEVILCTKFYWNTFRALVMENDGNSRFCFDYRQLNAVIKKEKGTMPHIDDIIDEINVRKTFNTIEMFQR